MKIEVVDTEVKTRSFRSKDGKDLTFREQMAWLHQDEKYPASFRLSLGDQPALEPGFYVLGSGSFFVDRFGGLSLKRVLLLEKIEG